ncbi:hypothetical protein ACIBTV_05975 [Micromonospora sp. NPDC049366]|uniref:hypothetical protein n=1 Tax=Micromonospora sp. NPDC049366 TaxID=3364271 RepID=UPI0037ABDD84
MRKDDGRIYLIDGDAPADSPGRFVDITDAVDDAQSPPAVLAGGLALNGDDGGRLRQFEILDRMVRSRVVQEGLDRDVFVSDLRQVQENAVDPPVAKVIRSGERILSIERPTGLRSTPSIRDDRPPFSQPGAPVVSPATAAGSQQAPRSGAGEQTRRAQERARLRPLPYPLPSMSRQGPAVEHGVTEPPPGDMGVDAAVGFAGPDSRTQVSPDTPSASRVRALEQDADGRWRADGLPLRVEVLEGSRSGLSLLSAEELSSVRDRQLMPPGRAPAVLVHGAGNVVHASVELPDGATRTVALSAAQLAQVVRGSVADDGLVALVSCRAGAVRGSFASKFSRAYGGDVCAPATDVWVGTSGGLATSGGQSWLLFEPDGSDSDGWDLINDEHDFDGIRSNTVPASPDGVRLSGEGSAQQSTRTTAGSPSQTDALTDSSDDVALESGLDAREPIVVRGESLADGDHEPSSQLPRETTAALAGPVRLIADEAWARYRSGMSQRALTVLHHGQARLSPGGVYGTDLAVVLLTWIEEHVQGRIRELATSSGVANDEDALRLAEDITHSLLAHTTEVERQDLAVGWVGLGFTDAARSNVLAGPVPQQSSGPFVPIVVQVEADSSEGREPAMRLSRASADDLASPVHSLAREAWARHQAEEEQPTLRLSYHYSAVSNGRIDGEEIVEPHLADFIYAWIRGQVEEQLRQLLSSDQPGVDAAPALAAAVANDLFEFSMVRPDSSVPAGSVRVEFAEALIDDDDLGSVSSHGADLPVEADGRSDASDDAGVAQPERPTGSDMDLLSYATTGVWVDTDDLLESDAGDEWTLTGPSADDLSRYVPSIAQTAWERHQAALPQQVLIIVYDGSDDDSVASSEFQEIEFAEALRHWIRGAVRDQLLKLFSASMERTEAESLADKISRNLAKSVGIVDDHRVPNGLLRLAFTTQFVATEALVWWPRWGSMAGATEFGDPGEVVRHEGYGDSPTPVVSGKTRVAHSVRRVGSRVWVVPPQRGGERQRRFVAPGDVPDNVVLVGAVVNNDASLSVSDEAGRSLTVNDLLDQLASGDGFEMAGAGEGADGTNRRVLVLVLQGLEGMVDAFAEALFTQILERHAWGEPGPSGLVIGSYEGAGLLWYAQSEAGLGEPYSSPIEAVNAATPLPPFDLPGQVHRRLAGESVRVGDSTLASLVLARLPWDSVLDPDAVPQYAQVDSGEVAPTALAEMTLRVPPNVPSVLDEVRRTLRGGRVLPVLPAGADRVAVRVGSGLVAPIYRLPASGTYPSRDVFVLHQTGDEARIGGQLTAVPIWVNRFADGFVAVRIPDARAHVRDLSFAPSLADRIVLEPGELSADGTRVRNTAIRDQWDDSWLTADEYRQRLVTDPAGAPPIVILLGTLGSSEFARDALFSAELAQYAIVLVWNGDKWHSLRGPGAGADEDTSLLDLAGLIRRADSQEQRRVRAALLRLLTDDAVSDSDVAMARHMFREGSSPASSSVTVRLPAEASEVEEWIRHPSGVRVVSNPAAPDQILPVERLTGPFLDIPATYVRMDDRTGLFVVATAAWAEQRRMPPSYSVLPPSSAADSGHSPLPTADDGLAAPETQEVPSLSEDVRRVRGTLTALGASAADGGAAGASLSETAPSVSADLAGLAAGLGGSWRPAALADLEFLSTGAVTAVRVESSNGAERLFLVNRQDDGQLSLINVYVPADSPDRLVDITDAVDNGAALRAVRRVELIVDEQGRLGQLDVSVPGRAWVTRSGQIPTGFVRNEFARQLPARLATPAGVVASQDRLAHLAQLDRAIAWWEARQPRDRLDGLFTAVGHVEALLGLGAHAGAPTLLDADRIADVLIGVHEASVADDSIWTGRSRLRVETALRTLEGLWRRLHNLRQPAPEIAEHIRRAQHFAQGLSSQLRSVLAHRGNRE